MFLGAKTYRSFKPTNYDRKPVHFGFLLGINSMDFKITPQSVQADTLFILKSQEQKGFNLGIVSNFRLGRNTDLRFLPTLSFAERDINYTIEIEGNLEEIKKDVDPLLLNFQSTSNLNQSIQQRSCLCPIRT